MTTIRTAVELCHNISTQHGIIVQLREEVNDIEDHAEQAEAEEFQRSLECNLYTQLVTLHTELSKMQGTR